MRFFLKAITVYSKKKRGFYYKNNHGYSKLANFWLNNINKINYRMLVIL